MRKSIITMMILSFLILPVYGAQDQVDDLRQQLPGEALACMPQEEQGFLPGLLEIFTEAMLAVAPGLKKTLAVCAGVVAAAVLCGLFQAGDTGLRTGTANLLGTAAIGTILLGETGVLIGQGLETVQAIEDFGKLLLPVMSAAMVSSGGVTTASGLYLGTALFDSILSWLISGILAPLVYLFLALALASAAIGSDTLEKMKDFFKNLVAWGLKLVLYIFSSFMAITGVVSGTVDATAVKVTKMTISGVVPIVGGIMSDATETVLAGAAAVRSGAGLLGLFAVLSITAVPFLKLALQYLLLKLTAGLCTVAGSEEQGTLVEGFAQAMGLILAMVGTGCVLQIISIACFMKGVG